MSQPLLRAALCAGLAATLTTACVDTPFGDDGVLPLARASTMDGSDGPAKRPARDSAPAPTDAVTSRVAFELARAESRLSQELPLPDRLREQRCPDQSFRQLSETDRTLVLVNRDARLNQRHVLPLRLRQYLRSDDLQPVRSRLVEGQGELLAAVAPRFPDADSANAALNELLQFNQRRLFGVYQIVHYEAPRWLRKPNRRRPMWRPGALHAWLVVYDTRAEQPTCQVRIAVLNDTTGASLRVRLRSDTRKQLIEQLGRSLRERTAAELGRISAVLALPPPVAANQ